MRWQFSSLIWSVCSASTAVCGCNWLKHVCNCVKSIFLGFRWENSRLSHRQANVVIERDRPDNWTHQVPEESDTFWWMSHTTRAERTSTQKQQGRYELSLKLSHNLWLSSAEHMAPQQTSSLDGKWAVKSFLCPVCFSIHLYSQMFAVPTSHKLGNRTLMTSLGSAGPYAHMDQQMLFGYGEIAWHEGLEVKLVPFVPSLLNCYTLRVWTVTAACTSPTRSTWSAHIKTLYAEPLVFD